VVFNVRLFIEAAIAVQLVASSVQGFIAGS